MQSTVSNKMAKLLKRGPKIHQRHPKAQKFATYSPSAAQPKMVFAIKYMAFAMGPRM